MKREWRPFLTLVVLCACIWNLSSVNCFRFNLDRCRICSDRVSRVGDRAIVNKHYVYIYWVHGSLVYCHDIRNATWRNALYNSVLIMNKKNGLIFNAILNYFFFFNYAEETKPLIQRKIFRERERGRG